AVAGLAPRVRRAAAVVGVAALANLGGSSVLAAQQLPAGLRILVTDAETGRPIEGAVARLEAEDGKVGHSGADGRVLLGGIAAGARPVVIEAAGYRPQRMRLQLPPGGVLEVSVALGVATGFEDERAVDRARRSAAADSVPPEAIELDPVHVAVERRSDWLARIGFHDRAEIGLGTFIPPDEIERRLRAGGNLSDLLRTVTGLRVTPVGSSAYQLQTARGLASITQDCAGPRIWLDGVRLPADAYRDVNSIVSAHALAGVEVYRGPAEVPSGFGGTGATCGVVLLWTGGR
ncbi:MAG: TonB-dependent receptor plug domain-containing protein, partial [Gemmatimonadota bacterium]